MQLMYPCSTQFFGACHVIDALLLAGHSDVVEPSPLKEG